MFTGIIKHTGKISKIYKNNNNCIIEILSSIKFLKSEIISSLLDSVEIQIGQILRRYQNGSIGIFNGLKLKTSGNLYNYSKLSIKNNPRIDVMYSQ